MKTVIEMALDTGFDADDETTLTSLERFAELVRADEREKYKWDVHSCGPTCTKIACVAVREAVEAEREACAKVCEMGQHSEYDGHAECAAAIRARSST